MVDNRSAPDGTSTYRRAFEEYRYDALGRRVWVRARRECHQGFSGYCELGWVRRTVWDGDRELYEIQAPSSGEVPYDDARREIGICRAHEPWGVHALIAHELTGHGLGVARHGRASSQLEAIEWENRWNRVWVNRPDRSARCHP